MARLHGFYDDTVMLGRLGDVLYWTGSGISLLILAVALIRAGVNWGSLATEDNLVVSVLLGGAALVIWLFGRACRYVLAGK